MYYDHFSWSRYTYIAVGMVVCVYAHDGLIWKQANCFLGLCLPKLLILNAMLNGYYKTV